MNHEYRTTSGSLDGPAFFSVEETRTTHPAMRREYVHHVVRHPGGSAIVALRGDHILCIEQYRPAVDDVLLELPAGRSEPGETPRQTAARELLEETGYVAEELVHLFDFHNAPSFCDGVTHLFVAYGLSSAAGRVEDGIPLKVHPVPLADVTRLIAEGHITDAGTIIGMLAVAGHLKEGGRV